MQEFFINVANLLRLRGGPQDFSPTWLLTLLLVAGYLAQNLINGSQINDPDAAAKSILGMGMQITALCGLLYWRGHIARLPQSLSALAAVGIVFNLITWVLLTQSNPEISQPTLAMVWLVVFIWSLFVDANVYRHALSVNLSTGVLISVLLLAATYTAIEFLFLKGSGI
jgi:predicted neutral ceramidase superfamily lipid hydrolase